MVSSQDIIDDSVSLLSEYIGAVTAQMYRRFFKEQDVKGVLKSTEDVLSQLIGPQKAHIEVLVLAKKYNITA